MVGDDAAGHLDRGVRPKHAGDRWWHVLGRWASGRTTRHRTSVTGDPEVDTDVWWPRARVGLVSAPGDPARIGHTPPAVHSARRGGQRRTGAIGDLLTTTRETERILDVPRLSQMTWKGVGGDGWCSPTSVAMVLSHAGTLPPTTDSGIVDVARAAAEVHDPAYGAGNWPFNTAWAATLTGHAFVTRLRDLRDAERFIDAGVPLVASVAYPGCAQRRSHPRHRGALWS